MRHVKQLGDTKIGRTFARTAMRIEEGTHVRLGGLLTPAGPLRRCQLVELPPQPARSAQLGSPGGRGGARAQKDSMLRLRIRGDAMSADGIRDGDYLVLDTRRGSLREGQTVLADDAGCMVVRRVGRTPRCARGGRGDEAVPLEAPPATGAALPLLGRTATARVHGAVVGVLRKSVRAKRLRTAGTGEPSPSPRVDDVQTPPPVEPLRRLHALRRSLSTVRATYEATRHPLLRRALRDEARVLSREMARERARLGNDIGEVVLLN